MLVEGQQRTSLRGACRTLCLRQLGYALHSPPPLFELIRDWGIGCEANAIPHGMSPRGLPLDRPDETDGQGTQVSGFPNLGVNSVAAGLHEARLWTIKPTSHHASLPSILWPKPPQRRIYIFIMGERKSLVQNLELRTLPAHVTAADVSGTCDDANAVLFSRRPAEALTNRKDVPKAMRSGGSGKKENRQTVLSSRETQGHRQVDSQYKVDSNNGLGRTLGLGIYRTIPTPTPSFSVVPKFYFRPDQRARALARRRKAILVREKGK